jgi:serine/threonine-protein kinase HipA
LRLDVQVRRKTVASLYRERDEYVLRYLPQATETDFVSLTMPVRDEPWRWPRDLHPFFRQNLPEGYLLGVIREEFGPLLDGTDLSLLAVVGAAGIGRVTVTPEGGVPGVDLQPVQIEQLLRGENTAAKFASLVRQYARAAISGAVPKFIAPELTPGEGATPLGKSSLRTSRHIVKGSDENFPYLGFNEFYSMRVLERLKVVPVAKTRLSEDGRVLIVDRFDVDESGDPVYGLEDACGLLGLPPHEKYATSMEKVLNATRAYLPAATTRTQLQQLGWHILTNYVVRNADCHAKNIAIFYGQHTNVAYTPVYDIVTTQAYPRFANSPPGLSIEGRKTWTPGKSLERFFNARLGISPRDYAQMVERLSDAAVDVGREIIQAQKKKPHWREISKQMLHAWNEGMASIQSVRKAPAFKRLSEHIKAAGFSDATPPEPPEKLGLSELLPQRRPRRAKRRARAPGRAR